MAGHDGSISFDVRLQKNDFFKGVEEIKKAIESLQSTVESIGRKLSSSATTYIRGVNKGVQSVSENVGEVSDKSETFSGSLDSAAKSAEDLEKEISTTQGVVKGTAESAVDLKNAFDSMSNNRSPVNTGNIKKTGVAFDELTRKAQRYQDIIAIEGRGSEAFKDLEKEIQKTENEIDKLTDQIDQMERAGVTEQNQGKYERLNKTLSQTKHEYGQLQQIREEAMQTPDLDSMSDSANEASTSLNRAANSATRFASKIASGALKTAVNTIKSMGSAAVRAATNLAKMVGSNVLSFLRKLAEGAKNAAVQLAKMVTSAVANGVKKLGTLAGKATKSLLGLNKASRGDGFKEGLKFLVRYGFGVRSLFMLYRKLRGAVVEAFENMAKKVPEVNKSLSRLASSFDLLKNSLATAFQPILTAVTPYLVQLMDMMSEAAAKVGEFFAVLTGQNYIYKATKANIDYAKSLDKSTKSTKKNTKETENQLASFDHLNILKENKDTGSSSDSDKNETPTSDFNKVPIESAISDLAKRIKDAFNKGDFTEIGKILANKLTEWVNEVDWDGLGKKIGEGINHIVDVINGFFDNFDWVDLGQKFAEGLNSLIDNVNFYELGRAITQKLRALIEMAWGVVSDINWEKVGDAIGNYIQGAFDNIPWETLGETVGTAITGVFRALQNAIVSFGWADAGERLANALNSMFDSINWVQIGNTINALFKGVLKGLKTFIATFDWDSHAKELERGFKNFIKKLPTADIGEVLKNATIKIIRFIRKGLIDKDTWGQAGTKFGELLNKLFETDGKGNTIWTELALAVGDLAESVVTAISATVNEFEWGDAGQSFHDAILLLVEKFPLDELGSGLSDLMAGALEFLNETLGDEKLFNQLGTDTADFFNKFTGNTALWDEIGEGVNNAFLGVLAFGQGFVDGFNETDAADAIKRALGKIDFDDIATKTWNLLKSAFAKAGSFVDALFSESLDNTRAQIDPAYVEKITSFNAQNTGAKIGAKLSEALSKVPWAEVGKTFNQLLADGLNFLENFVKSFNRQDFVDGFEAALEEVEWGKIAIRMITLFLTAVVESIGAFDDIIRDSVARMFGITDKDEQLELKIKQMAGYLMSTGAYATWEEAEKAAANVYGVGEYIADNTVDGYKDETVAKQPEVDSATESMFTMPETVPETANQDGSNVADQSATGYIDKMVEKQPEAQSAAEDAFTIPLTLSEEISTDAETVANGGANSYINTLDGRKDEVSDKYDEVYLPSPEELKDMGYYEGQTIADNGVDGTVSELNAKEKEVKKAYEGTFVKTYEDGVEGSSGFDIGSGKSSRTGKLGIANVKNLSEGMDSEKHTLQRSLKGLVDESDSSWANAKRGQARELDSMSSKLSTSMREMTSTSSRETSEQERSITSKWRDIERDQSSNLNDMDRNLSDVMGSMTSTSDTETSNQAKPVYDNYGEIMVAVDECMRAARDYLVQYAGDMTDNLSGEMNAMGNLGWWVVGDAIIDGIADGIYNGWNWLNNTVWNLANSLFRSAKNALGIHSPSRVFREGIGENIGLGIAEGILDTQSDVMDSVASLADLASETMNETDFGDFVNADGTGLVDGLDSVLDVFSNKVQNSFSDMLSKLNAIANTVTFRTPAIATGTVLPYAVLGGQTGGSKAISDVVAKTNDEQTSALIQAFNNQTVAIVRAIEQYSTTNVNIDKKSLTDAIIEEINRRTRAQGKSPLLI